MFNHKTMLSHRIIPVIISLFLLFQCSLVSASIGKILLAIGDVKVQRGEPFKAKRGTELEEGDIIITGKRGRVQLLMLDGARIAIKPDTELSLENYRYVEKTKDITTKGESSMTMSVIKGGFRTITGAIAKDKDKSRYKVKTPIATIGIRGTDYELLLTQIQPNSSLNESLAVGVWNGSISISNSVSSIEIGDTESFRFATVYKNSAPSGQDQPPAGIGDTAEPTVDDSKESDSSVSNDSDSDSDSDDSAEDSDGSESESTKDIADAQENSNDQDGNVLADSAQESEEDLPVSGGIGSDGSSDDHNFEDGVPNITTHSVAVSSALLNGHVSSAESTAELTVVENGILQSFSIRDASGADTTFTATDVTHLNIGFDPASGISWGRWAEGSVSYVDAAGQTQSLDLTSQSLHWAFETSSGSNTSLPVTGSANYQLIGNTDPTNNFGNTGVLGSASLAANFSTNSLSTSLDLAIAGNVWSASGNGSITSGSSLFSGQYDQVLINGQSGGSGDFSGFFSSMFDAATGVPAGAGLVYLLESNGSIQEIVNGSLVFGNPQP